MHLASMTTRLASDLCLEGFSRSRMKGHTRSSGRAVCGQVKIPVGDFHVLRTSALTLLCMSHVGTQPETHMVPVSDKDIRTLRALTAYAA
jgi:hypothetical protein